MTVITNLNRVADQISRIGNAPQFKNVSVIVGYSAAYALHVHERLDIPHQVGQAKYLEQPARELQPEIGRVIVTTFKKTMNLKTSLMFGGMLLQRESMQLVPVDTGALRASAFTKAE